MTLGEHVGEDIGEHVGEDIGEHVEAPASLEGLRDWYHAHKASPECALAMKHLQAMAPGVAEALRPALTPEASDEERDLTLLFSMTQIAAQLDIHAVLLNGIKVEMVPAQHVDVTPLEALPRKR